MAKARIHAAKMCLQAEHVIMDLDNKQHALSPEDTERSSSDLKGPQR